MGSKTICFIVVFSILHQVAFGCMYEKINCTYEVHCTGSDYYLSYDRVGEGYYQQYCAGLANYNGLNLLPVRLYLTRPGDGKVPRLNARTVLNTIISVDITYQNLQSTPTLDAMGNLKTLNFSNNNLQAVDLSNDVDLINLQEIDLSHNFISSVQVNDRQFVYKNLRKVNLSYNALANISGGVFDSFKFMEFLDLSYNNLATIDQYTFEGLKSLKYLSLSHNSIMDINSSLFRFIYLEELYLDNNNIETLSTQDFVKLEKLQILNLDYNKISRIEKDTFNSMASLTTLKLHHNLLSYVNKEAFISTNNLKAVDMSNNLLKSLPKDLFINKSISSFSITGNNLEGALSKGIFEGIHITELNIASQEITAIEDYAFFGLDQLTVLLLNNNKICNVSYHAFKTLKNLNQLDLSNNLITNLNFDTTDLLSLQTYSLRKNVIQQIRHDYFHDLINLNFLDLSNNNITRLEANYFISIETLKNFEIFHNPLNGTLLQNTFNGLGSVPILDLSCTSLTTIQNGSFNGMVQMQSLNISRSLINKLEYNAFMNTGNLKVIDLSYNKLTDFFVNTSNIRSLTKIFLNDNALLNVSPYCFKGMSLLNTVVISNNSLRNLYFDAFTDQTELNYLDLSLNNNLVFYTSSIKNLRHLEKLMLSCEIEFEHIGNVYLKHLEISNSRYFNVSRIELNKMKSLTDLVLTKDKIVKIEPFFFKNLSVLERLDLSFNNISSIQPGSFKDNILLNKLNLSHNFLTTLSYGIFRGLTNLKILDVSFNAISKLNRERFYDLPNMDTLLIDHNRVNDVDNDIFDINLRLLSIGNNPLPCEKIVHMKKRKELNISAINIDEHNGDNIDGIICNVYHNDPKLNFGMIDSKDNEKFLLGVKEILLNLSRINQDVQLSSDSRNYYVLKSLFNKMEKYDTEQNNITSELSQMTNVVNTSNLFLDKILKAVLGLGSHQTTPVPMVENKVTENENNTRALESNLKLSDVASEVSQLKQELLLIQDVISKINTKTLIDRISSQPLLSEKLNTSDTTVDRNTGKPFGFVEVCVSLILIILVCFILYKFYQSKMFVPNSRSLSTRHITDAMDNTNL